MSVQLIRVIDVLLIAPFLLYAGAKDVLTDKEKNILLLIGLSTLIYNGVNYLKNKK